jgi:hypothetical protein
MRPVVRDLQGTRRSKPDRQLATAGGRRGIVTASQEILIFSERPDVTAELLAVGRELARAPEGGIVALITAGDASTGSGKAHAEDAIAHGGHGAARGGRDRHRGRPEHAY